MKVMTAGEKKGSLLSQKKREEKDISNQRGGEEEEAGRFLRKGSGSLFANRDLICVSHRKGGGGGAPQRW